MSLAARRLAVLEPCRRTGSPAWFAWLLLAVALIFVALGAGLVFAAEVALSWNANSESDLAGYKLYQSTVSGQYGPPTATLGTVTQHTLTLPDAPTDRTYYFTLTAYDLAGNESGKSNEVSTTIPATAPPVQRPGTASLTVTAITPTQFEVSWPTVSDGAGGSARIDLRLGRPGEHWGLMISQPCVTSPCQITGLTPATAYLVQAVWYRGMLGDGTAVFGELSPVLTATTPALPVDPPPANPTGLTIVSRSASEIVIVASAADCPRVLTSTKGSTASRRMRTVTCAR